MRVRANTLTFDGRGKYYSMNDEFELEDERAEYLASLGAVELLEKPKNAQSRRVVRKPDTK